MRDAGSFLLSELRFFTAADIIALLLHEGDSYALALVEDYCSFGNRDVAILQLTGQHIQMMQSLCHLDLTTV